MSLMIDIGNTKTKYAHFVGGSIKEKGSCRAEELPKIISKYSGKVKNIMLSSVKLNINRQVLLTELFV